MCQVGAKDENVVCRLLFFLEREPQSRALVALTVVTLWKRGGLFMQPEDTFLNHADMAQFGSAAGCQSACYGFKSHYPLLPKHDIGIQM